MNHVRCAQCGIAKAATWIGKSPKNGCARQEPVTAYGMCSSIHIEILRYALRRAVAPQCFDDRAFMLPGKLIEALEAERDAFRKAAAVHGPFLEKPSDHIVGPDQQ